MKQVSMKTVVLLWALSLLSIGWSIGVALFAPTLHISAAITAILFAVFAARADCLRDQLKERATNQSGTGSTVHNRAA